VERFTNARIMTLSSNARDARLLITNLIGTTPRVICPVTCWCVWLRILVGTIRAKRTESEANGRTPATAVPSTAAVEATTAHATMEPTASAVEATKAATTVPVLSVRAYRRQSQTSSQD